VINIVVTIKTIHILDKTVEIPSISNYDRLGPEVQSYPPVFAIYTELIESGEIPRYSGAEVDFVYEEDRTIITTQFATRAGAEKWVAWVRDDNYALISIELDED
jgi:hypothetical protein